MAVRNFKIIVAYDGTDFVGWQRQSLPGANNRSVQQAIEQALKQRLRETITLHGAGRTDSGVHAFGQAASFFTKTTMPAANLPQAINGVLPSDVRVLSCQEVDADFHARYDAIGKTYAYYFAVGSKPTAFNWRQLYFYNGHLDLAKMAEAARLFEGWHNFESFTAKGNFVRDYQREIYRCRLDKLPRLDNLAPWQQTGEIYRLQVVGGGFMYKMVRLLMGSLFTVGTGRHLPEDLTQALERPGKIIAPTAPAQGLYLQEVFYEQRHLQETLVAIEAGF